MNIFRYAVLGVLSMGVLGAFLYYTIPYPAIANPAQAPAQNIVYLPADQILIRKASGEEIAFMAELALTPKDQATGMMYRTSMPDNTAMLFIFDDEDRRSFWMKNTYIPLDILFLHGDGRIHHIHTNARPQDETLITSEADSKAVLEIPGGTADRLGLKPGDTVIYKAFGNAEN